MTTSKDKIEESLQTFDRHDDDLALARAIELTFALQAKPAASQAAALAVRDKKLQRLLSIFNHIEAKRDPRFDPNDLPQMNPDPPPRVDSFPASLRKPSAIRPSGPRTKSRSRPPRPRPRPTGSR